ncbi:HAD-IA family hydrolase [Shewanella sp. UCD-KL12]|uniref:HAD-IA family hydrolase n=1 Tax=Shewanella sp. UCD-KL12 TaxID=1917163 RepID=UPI000970BFAA|nr:HAD-IA family hydrolase [Shewanella sp. UCD-KL12]
MKQYELVIFDWDGTLMDSVGKIVTCLQSAAVSLELAVPTEQAIRDIIGLSIDEALAVLHPESDHSVHAKMKEGYRIQYLELNNTPSPLFHGVEDLLIELQQLGIKLAVATGKGRSGLDRVLTSTELDRHFSASRSADEASSKPSPEMILQLLNELEVEASKALMIGDSIHDLNMANNAGVDAIGVDYGAHNKERLALANPIAVISSPLELLHHISR